MVRTPRTTDDSGLSSAPDSQTFTDAAIALGTSQAAISRSVASLERALGQRILQRTTRQVTPTAAGERIIEHARRILDEVADFSGRTVAVDHRTGTTTEDLWPGTDRPASFRLVQGMDEWLTLISTGQAIGISSEATAAQNPRPGNAYRAVRDAPPISVFLASWKDDPSVLVADFTRLAREAFIPDHPEL